MRITDVRVVVHERQTIRNAPPLPPDGRMPMGVLRILTDDAVDWDVIDASVIGDLS